MNDQVVVKALTLLCCSLTSLTVLAQTPTPPKSVLCNRINSLSVISQQIEGSKTLDDAGRRVAILIRAADLMWPYQEPKARTAYTEAMDVALEAYRATGDVVKSDSRLMVRQPDLRFTVIAAIAKRDSEWARKLSEQVRQEAAKEAESKGSSNPQNDALMADKLMSLATGLLDKDPQLAITFARTSLRYPATINLPFFLYQLSALNKALADQYYLEALNVYRDAPMDSFLYLSSYPFGNNREAGEMMIYTIYRVPAGFVPNPELQRTFLQALIGRAQRLIASPADATKVGRYTEAAQMWMAASRLDSQVQSSFPDLASVLQQAKESLFGLIAQKDQPRVSQTLVEPPKKTFDEKIEDALKQKDAAARESGIAFAILGSDSEEIEKVVNAADKIEDTQLRAQLLSRLFYNRSRKAIAEKSFDEARRLSARVDDLDLRAYLYSQIASETIKESKDDSQIREMLEEVVTASTKAPDTEVKARSLLGVAYLYAKLDANRAVSVLADAVKTINRIEAPDFSRDYVMKRLEGKSFASFTSIQTPGFNPENAFREMGKIDFDGTYYQSGNFSNKPLRSLTTLALVEPCLVQATKSKTTKSK